MTTLGTSLKAVLQYKFGNTDSHSHQNIVFPVCTIRVACGDFHIN